MILGAADAPKGKMLADTIQTLDPGRLRVLDVSRIFPRPESNVLDDDCREWNLCFSWYFSLSSFLLPASRLSF